MTRRSRHHKTSHSGGKRPLTFRYLFFYALFWPDTYRMLIGLAAGLVSAPLLYSDDTGLGTKLLLFIMIATIGYAVSGIPARAIAAFFRRRILR